MRRTASLELQFQGNESWDLLSDSEKVSYFRILWLWKVIFLLVKIASYETSDLRWTIVFRARCFEDAVKSYCRLQIAE